MKYVIALGLLLALLVTVPAPATAQTNAPTIPLSFPVSATGGGQSFSGTFNLQHFAVVNNQLAAVGTLVGTVTDVATGTVLRNVVAAITAPVTNASSSCPILHLVIGPIDLSLLGLNVSTNQIVLDITAVPGAGNLLGNLLCSVANLLNGTGPLSQISALLNNILTQFGSL